MDVMERRRMLLMMQKADENLFTRVGEYVGDYVGSDGNRHHANGWIASDWISVLPNTAYQFEPNSTAGASAKHVFYDENKSKISYIDSGAQTFTTPSNSKYMLFSYRDSSYDITLKYA